MTTLLKITACLGLLVSLAGCSSTTVLLANFNAEPIGASPAFNQPTGTVVTADGAGSVRVANPPSSSNKWARISHPSQPAPENNVRLNDDNANRFGTFPRDQSFVVSIQVDSTVSPPKATIGLLGSGASGSKDVVLPSLATQFGAVRVWMGFQWTGSFFVDDILVTRRNS